MVVASLTMTSEREEVIDFVAPYFEQSGILIGKKFLFKIFKKKFYILHSCYYVTLYYSVLCIDTMYYTITFTIIILKLTLCF